ncbi:polyprenyl synthetase family protein [Lutimonas halocynthiae]|uniref:polyprenyl synthetase family protein n=1 Tax=Lutimonas halocynthiae TaxID=1446477 RepID=UPI0025B553CA|nr:polyprenyl synthetase family protein [Lutimonas halocynthiae]MDN3643125.1 polyprenyl synthetase family protein [Lutimonas halocynthiae]
MLTMEMYRNAFLTYLNEQKNNKEPENLYTPIDYIMGLGGKRIRPVLVLMSSDLFGGDYNEAMEAALSVEMFHNFTLIHDDVMDKADLRRGNQTVHKKWDLNTAILSGDALMIMSNQRLEHYSGETFKLLISLYNKTALEVCEGQQLDVDFEDLVDVPLATYIKMISYKTAVLVGASLKMGAIIADASLDDQQKIYDFGLNLGIAFQLQDDYLDTFGTEDFGKRIGGDILEGKKTFLYIMALELANDEDRAKLLELYSTDLDEDYKIAEVKKLLIKYGLEALLTEHIEQYTMKAFQDIEGLSIESSKKQVLKNFGLGLMNRKT